MSLLVRWKPVVVLMKPRVYSNISCVESPGVPMRLSVSHRHCSAGQHCVNGNSGQWEGSNFDPLQNINPWIDCQQTRHSWLGPRDDPTCQIWWQSIEAGLVGKWMKCALSCSAVYCNRSCLWVCLWVCSWVCYHDNLKLRASILTKHAGIVSKLLNLS